MDTVTTTDAGARGATSPNLVDLDEIMGRTRSMSMSMGTKSMSGTSSSSSRSTSRRPSTIRTASAGWGSSRRRSTSMNVPGGFF